MARKEPDMTARYAFTCEQCRQEFPAARPHARFCSARCRVAWNRAHPGGEPHATPPIQPSHGPDLMSTPPDRGTHEPGQAPQPICRSATGPPYDEPAPARPVTHPAWRHNDRQQALSLLRAHLGTEAEARTALKRIEQLADPRVMTLEAWVREAAPRRAIRPLLAAAGPECGT
jgi:hypothetical protein